MTTLAIGAVAERTGLTVSAVRYYDDIAMISAIERVGGKRRFAEETVGRVNFIRRSQSAGFSLDEIRGLLDESNRGWRTSVDDKIAELTERRHQLDEMLDLLGNMRDCGCAVIAQCPRTIAC